MRPVLFLSLMLLFQSVRAQQSDWTTDLHSGTVQIGFQSDPVMRSFQLTTDYFVHDHWSLYYRAAWQPAIPGSPDDYQIPIGPATGVGLLFLAGGAYGCGVFDDALFELTLLSCIIPDGVSYHFYPTPHTSVSPYVVVSGLAYRRATETYDNMVYYSPSAGLRFMAAPFGDLFVITADQQFRRSWDNRVLPQLMLGFSSRF